MIGRKTLLVFAALFLAGVSGIVAGRLIGLGNAQEEPALTAGRSRIGTALDHALGLAPQHAPGVKNADRFD